MKPFVRGIYAINKTMFLISTLLLGASVFITFFNVIVRKFFSFTGGLIWPEELATYCCVLMLFIGVSYLEFTNQHLSIGIIGSLIKNEKAHDIVEQVLRIFRAAVTFVLLAIVLRYGLIVLQNMYQTNMVTYAMLVPKIIYFIPMLFGFAMTIVVWITILIFYKGKEVNYDS